MARARRNTGSLAFGQELKRLRDAQRLSQPKLGALIGFGRKAISEWERGAARPTNDSLKLLEQHLGFNQQLAKALLDGTPITDERLRLIQIALLPTDEAIDDATKELSVPLRDAIDRIAEARIQVSLRRQRRG